MTNTIKNQWATPNTVGEYYSSKMTDEEKDACDKSLSALAQLSVRLPKDIDQTASDIVRADYSKDDSPDFALYLAIGGAILEERNRLVNRVARALCVEAGEDPDTPTPYNPHVDYVWQHYRNSARAAIRAMFTGE